MYGSKGRYWTLLSGTQHSNVSIRELCDVRCRSGCVDGASSSEAPNRSVCSNLCTSSYADLQLYSPIATNEVVITMVVQGRYRSSQAGLVHCRPAVHGLRPRHSYTRNRHNCDLGTCFEVLGQFQPLAHRTQGLLQRKSIARFLVVQSNLGLFSLLYQQGGKACPSVI